jgi:hypothetical protein
MPCIFLSCCICSTSDFAYHASPITTALSACCLDAGTYVPSGGMVTAELDGDPSTRKHFDLYDLDATGGRIHLDLVRLAFSLRTVKVNGVVLSRHQETALSNSRFKVDTCIKITGKPA